ncbi:glycogen-binding subunit 76A [Chrysoperla carnea]|uniref:glycogen-binding subunit 76A n=1 Tax=Chrysoperla carnea TaxID=189513 RepID=UPI001D06EA73|nr:glycogen-binding subunit 76A [Chrysoperla carnea]
MQRESSIGSVLPMTFRGHDEAFARHLQCRLKSLGNEIPTEKETETNSTKANNTNNNNEVFYEYSINSPESPIDETTAEPNFITCNEADIFQSLDSPDCGEFTCNTLKNVTNCLPNSSTHTCIINDDPETSDSSEYYDTENLDNELLNSISPRINLIEDNSDLVIDNNKINNSIEVPSNETQTNGKADNITNGENFCNSLNINKHMTIECTPKLEVSTVEVNIPESNNSNNNLSPNTINNTVDININDAEEEDESENRIPRIRRCSSLKTGKTPPGTPGQKKIVRFADVLGLDLADVRTYLDEIPKIPTSAYEDLNVLDLCVNSCDQDTCLNSLTDQIDSMYCRQKPEKVLVPLFQQPGGETDFIERVRQRQCCLENACVQDNVSLSIAGTVRVRNIDFNKSVHIRYTLDSWKTYSDLQATYVQKSCDGFSDKFTFLLYCHTLDIGQRIEFAIRYTTSNLDFWDNNAGKNYCFQCLPSVNNSAFVPITSQNEQWGNSSFY